MPQTMLQIELYVKDVEDTARMFVSVFGLTLFVESPGYKHFKHPNHCDIMLFNPSQNEEGDGNWPMPDGNGGQGIEVVLVTNQSSQKLQAIRALGYKCSELRETPWGTIEFTFQLKEGYLLRIKEPKATG